MVTRTPRENVPGASALPELDFVIEDAGVVPYAAVPTLNFRLRADSSGPPVRSAALKAQIRIAVTHRSYDEATRRRLVELFGGGADWAKNLRSLLWTHAPANLPPFSGSILVDVPVTCTYDFEVVSAKYLHSLRDGLVPLEFLFSGTVFYEGEGGSLRVAQLPWDKEATYELPVAMWRELMDRYWPDSAWLKLRRDTFDRLYAYKAGRTDPTWEAALESLLERAEEGQ